MIRSLNFKVYQELNINDQFEFVLIFKLENTWLKKIVNLILGNDTATSIFDCNACLLIFLPVVNNWFIFKFRLPARKINFAINYFQVEIIKKFKRE